MRELIHKHSGMLLLAYLIIGYKCGLTWAPETFSKSISTTHYEDFSVLYWLVAWPLGLALTYRQESLILLAVTALFLVAYFIQHLRNLGRISRYL